MREVFISNSGGVTTICGNRISNGKVWIKVCNADFDNDRNAFTHIITTEREGLLPTNNKTAKKSALGIFRQFLQI